MSRAAEAFEDHELEVVGVEHLQIGVGRLDEAGEVGAQEGELQVGGDAEGLGEAMAHELFDDAIGHDYGDGRKRVAALMVGDRFGERRDQAFEPV